MPNLSFHKVSAGLRVYNELYMLLVGPRTTRDFVYQRRPGASLDFWALRVVPATLSEPLRKSYTINLRELLMAPNAPFSSGVMWEG